MKKKHSPYTSIGGQALIEGIMMKSERKTVLAVRKSDGQIELTPIQEKTLRQKYRFLRIPVIRGVAAYIESMVTGYHAMMLSAQQSGYTDTTDEKTGKTVTLGKKAWAAILSVASVLAVALGVVLFMFLPRLAVSGIEALFSHSFSKVGRSLIEQGIKLVIFITYISLISLMKDIHRVFEYHGAEHKTIFCYEKKLPLTVENVRKQKRFHPRCGTSFLILMLIVSVFFSTVVQILFKGIYSNPFVWTLIKILLIPLICGTGFEVLRFCGKHDNLLTKILSAPGVWVQHITTKEPDDSMIEVAIAAMEQVIPENAGRDVAPTPDPQKEPEGEPPVGGPDGAEIEPSDEQPGPEEKSEES